jgi:hypothetical protein
MGSEGRVEWSSGGVDCVSMDSGTNDFAEFVDQAA